MTDGPVHHGPETPASSPQDERPASPVNAPVSPGAALSRQLGGDLPCVVCRYNLRGLSIRSVCPECGTAVRATILALVDPHAAELEPIISPRLTALGLIVWMGGAMLGAVLCWIPSPVGAAYDVWHGAVTGCVVLSGIGALSLVRPHAGAERLGTILAAMAVFLYAPLAWLVWEATSYAWTGGQPAIFPATMLAAQDRSPTLARLLICAIASGVGLLLRPNARLLVARSLALRTGRVDRQTILAIVAAAMIAGIGEVLLGAAASRVGMAADTARLAGEILVPAGWALVTLGMIGSFIDAVRISRAILMPAPTLHDVIASGARH